MLVGRLAPAVTRQQGRQPACGNQVTRQRTVERRQGDGVLPVQFNRSAAAAKQNDRSEHGIRGNSNNQFMSAGSMSHRLHGETPHLRLGQKAGQLLAHVCRSSPELVARGQPQRHTAHIGLVNDLG